MRHLKLFFLVVVCVLMASPVLSQYTDLGFEVGIHGGMARDQSTGTIEVKPGGMLGMDVGFPLFPALQLEASGSYAELHSLHTRTVFIPGDLKLKLAPVRIPGFIPYLFAGAGVTYYSHEKQPWDPAITAQKLDRTGYVMYVPAGVGMQFRVSDHTSLDLRGSWDYVASPNLTPDPDKDNDMFATALIGIRFNGGPRNKDIDGDGLLNKDEKRLGTNPKNPDTDGDGLTDGEEVHTYHTNPLKADTDDDGLSDGDEVHRYHTDPLKADTDGDGLSDGAEVNQYHTDPLKADTDGDGLNDGAEINQYHTDPLKADTDGDGLNDGDEVLKYHTDPLKMDTDGGTVPDGLEVERGTNPLDPSDDVPKTPPPQVLIFEKNKPVVLPGIQFEFNKAVIKPESESVLILAYNSLMEHPEVNVEIGGHTDSKGSDEYNQKLSERRAESVKAWLVAKNINANRITTRGYGESKPIASNETEEGRAQNRRIEFTRTN